MKQIYNALPYLMSFLMVVSCSKDKKLFERMPAGKTGVTFSNRIVESDSFNILTYQYIYNGGGVAIADFNNDGLQDIYFTANMVNCELYLNEGDFKFSNVTDVAGVKGEGKWCSGVSAVDINHDGWCDIYIAATTHSDSKQRENILYINQGLNENNVPVFKNMAKAYNVDDAGYTTNAAFFDYDNDGDLDLYLLVNQFNEYSSMNRYHEKMMMGESETTDKLLRNEGSDSLGHPYFVDVSKAAGITIEGYGLGINISDINKDGRKDVYVTNDFVTNDILYINNGDGTFTDRLSDYLKHTAHSAMGNNIADVNNDGHPDILALDMLPEDNYRKKMMLLPNNYNVYLNNERFGYHYQFVRNQLHLYQGINPDNGMPIFSDVGIIAGIAATDWSWTPLMADFDNDGWRDIIITNGFPKDITDHDFGDYHTKNMAFAPVKTMLKKIPSVKIDNYAFKNRGGYLFEDVTALWGMDIPSFSNGAVQADLDNDGDLDMVVNNIYDSAFVLRNRQEAINPDNHYLRVAFKGSEVNPMGLGAIVQIDNDGKKLYYEHNPYQGFLSSVEPVAHFGLGNEDTVEMVTVNWPDGSIQKLLQVPADQVITLDIKHAKKVSGDTTDATALQAPYFEDVTDELQMDYQHQELDFIDFNLQPLLPHKLSQFGPGIAIGDVNNDGLSDAYLSGAYSFKGSFFVQQKDGSFVDADLLADEGAMHKEEELGSLFFDADGDGDQDLYIVSGSYEHKAGSQWYQDRLFINRDGKFYHQAKALPEIFTSGSCVRAADYDKDGDLDLFVGGRVHPHEYPKPVSSYILENVSTQGEVKFVDVSGNQAPVLNKIGMVSDALWTDFDNDGWVDLVLAGEWMPVTFLKNEKGKLIDVTGNTGIADKIGWWNSLCAGDFDHDGDMDYVVGNLGTNTFFKASDEYPVSVYANDFDNNGGYDAVITVYFDDARGNKMEVPYHIKQDVGAQMKAINEHFPTHAAFANSDIQEILSKLDTTGTLKYRANHMETSYLENLGGGKFAIKPIDHKAQWAPVYGMLAEDVNQDGKLDVMLVGNDYGTEISTGRYDALNGLVLMGKGNGDFDIHDFESTGFFVPGDAKALAGYSNRQQALNVWASQNRDSLKCFRSKNGRTAVPVLDEDAYAIVHLQNGRSFKKEFYYGSGFLSQSARFLFIPENCIGIELISFTGDSRSISRNDLTVK